MKRAQGGTGLIITGCRVIGGSHGAETRDAAGVILPSPGSLSAQAEAQIASSPHNASWRWSLILLDRDRFGQLKYSSPPVSPGQVTFVAGPEIAGTRTTSRHASVGARTVKK